MGCILLTVFGTVVDSAFRDHQCVEHGGNRGLILKERVVEYDLKCVHDVKWTFSLKSNKILLDIYELIFFDLDIIFLDLERNLLNVNWFCWAWNLLNVKLFLFLEFCTIQLSIMCKINNNGGKQTWVGMSECWTDSCKWDMSIRSRASNQRSCNAWWYTWQSMALVRMRSDVSRE